MRSSLATLTPVALLVAASWSERVLAGGTGADGVFTDGFEEPLPALRYAFEGNGFNTGSLAGYDLSRANTTFGAGKVGQGITFATGGFGSVSGMIGSMGNYARVTIAFWLFVPAPLSNQAFWDTSNRSIAPYGGVQLGQSGSSISVCVSTTSSPFLSGSCNGFTAPSSGTWHHWLIRYEGTGIGPGQGGPTEIYVDNVLVHTRANDASNDPVFGPGMRDTMAIAGDGATMDELVVYAQVFTPAEQCTRIIGGTWTGSSCVLP